MTARAGSCRMVPPPPVASSSIPWHRSQVVRAAASFDSQPFVAPAEEVRLLELLRDALASSGPNGSATRLLSVDGVPVELPASVREVLVRVVRELAEGNAVTVLPVHAELTTQEAADLLNVSRPYLIGLLDDQVLPCTRTTGNHRRLRLVDVLAYKRSRDAARRAALDEMSEEAERLGLRY